MRKTILLAITTLLFASCTETLNDKAEKLIEADMEKTLVKPDTYSAIETRTDSAYAPEDNPELFSIIMQIANENININRVQNTIDELQNNMKNAQTAMNLSKSLKKGDSKDQYNNYKKYYDECARQLELIKPELNKINERVQKYLDNAKNTLEKERSFSGFKSIHTYKAKNYSDKELTDSCYYLFDKDMTKVITSMPLTNYNIIKQMIKDVIDDNINTVEKDSIK